MPHRRRKRARREWCGPRRGTAGEGHAAVPGMCRIRPFWETDRPWDELQSSERASGDEGMHQRRREMEKRVENDESNPIAPQNRSPTVRFTIHRAVCVRVSLVLETPPTLCMTSRHPQQPKPGLSSAWSNPSFNLSFVRFSSRTLPDPPRTEQLEQLAQESPQRSQMPRRRRGPLGAAQHAGEKDVTRSDTRPSCCVLMRTSEANPPDISQPCALQETKLPLPPQIKMCSSTSGLG